MQALPPHSKKAHKLKSHGEALMSFFAQPCTPFANLTLSSCLSSTPSSCCMGDHPEDNALVEVWPEARTVRLSYDSGAIAFINEEYQMFRSGCRMLWFRDRFGVSHVLD